MTDIVTTFSVAEEANTFSAGDNRVCSNGESREVQCSNGEGTGIGSGNASKKRPLHDRSGQGEELLYLWVIWAHSPSLQESGKNKSSR